MTLARLNEKCGCSVARSVTKVSDRVFRFIASDASVDCQGDAILASAWELRRYKKNPTVLFNHNADAPVARSRRTWVEAGKLLAEIEFPPAGANDLADEVHSKVASGLLAAMSIGAFFIEWADRADGGRTVSKAELLELSIVAVGCNAGALRVATAMTATHKTELQELVNNAVADAMAESKPKPHLVPASRVLAVTRAQISKAFRDEALGQLCDAAGLLDVDGVMPRARKSPVFGKALAELLTAAQTTADALTKSVNADLLRKASR